MLKTALAGNKRILGMVFALAFVITGGLSIGRAAAINDTPSGSPAYSICKTYAKAYDISTKKGSTAFKKYQNSGCGNYCSVKTGSKTVSGKKHTIKTVACKKPSAPTGGSSGSITDPALTSGGCNGSHCTIIDKYINPIIKLLSAAVGIVAVIAIIVGGIQVSTSAGDPQKTANGRNHVRNAIIGLVAYILLLIFLNWIIPGGIT